MATLVCMCVRQPTTIHFHTILINEFDWVNPQHDQQVHLIMILEAAEEPKPDDYFIYVHV